MILLVLPAVLAVIVALLYFYLRNLPDRRSLWRTTLQIGLGVGVSRAVLASIGWYTVEHTGGPLQIPGFALAMLAWPEAFLIDRRRLTPASPEFFVGLSALLILSTAILVSLVALVAATSRAPHGQPGTSPKA